MKPMLRGLKTRVAFDPVPGNPHRILAYLPTAKEKRPWKLPHILIGLMDSTRPLRIGIVQIQQDGRNA